MITFLICLTLLVGAYFTYGKYLERTFEASAKAEVPSKTDFDGVDYLPLPMWKTFLIQLLNIAGLGPIFGALLGAMYGPVAFLWITLGGILIGGLQDYASGMLSIRKHGLSFPEIVGEYLGLPAKQFMRLITIALMVLVGAVFMVGPAGILASMTPIGTQYWVYIILVYYILATVLPIDKIMGRVYPIFGAALFIMALGVLYALLFQEYTIPELSAGNWINFKLNAEKYPIFPTLFVTIACGAVSGFHATQSPLMARCMTNQMQGRPVFYGAMISESIIALIWAAIGMAFWGGVPELNATLAEHGNNAAWAVDKITKTTLGQVGAALALLGVVVAPITSGDSAFRSTRLMVADIFKLEQRTYAKRLYICIPLFAIGFAITLMDFGVIWQYFAWLNQTLAVICLWTITVFMYRQRKNYLIALLPSIFMTFVVCSYLMVSAEGFQMPYAKGMVIGCAGALLFTAWNLYFLYKRCKRVEQ